MKRDIRELFKGGDLGGKKLPTNHRIEFTEKLEFSNTENSKKKDFSFFLKVAASLILILTTGIYIVNQRPSEIKKSSLLELQVQQIEQDYLQKIDNEWQNFIKVTDDKFLIKKYRQKLDDLDKNYKELSKSFEENTNNIMILEDLIGNLQNRLQLLKDIQNHIETLNKNKKTYETIIL